MISTSAGNGLNAANSVLCNGKGVATKNKASSTGGKFWKTSYRQVLVVEIGVVE